MDDLFGDIAPSGSSTSGSTSKAYVDEEYESVLFVARESYVYRLPARTSTAGYKAAEWVRRGRYTLLFTQTNAFTQGDMEAFLWKGNPGYSSATSSLC